jgi:hypothetical protein
LNSIQHLLKVYLQKVITPSVVAQTSDSPTFQSSLIQKVAPLAALCGCILLLIVLVIERGLWNYPVLQDAGVQLYLGQSMTRGTVPYRDFVHFQPPARLLVGWLWAATAQVTGLPIVHIGRVYCLLAAIALLVVLYDMGRRLTGRAVGGVYTVVILMGLDTLANLVVRGPNIRMFAAMIAVSGVWMAQRRHWWWAGGMIALTMMMW